jgi:hypothetical protein
MSKNQDFYNALSADKKKEFNAQMDAMATKLLTPVEPPAPDGNAHWAKQPHGAADVFSPHHVQIVAEENPEE